jgi:ATP-binding cassette, subfamily B, bacterial PglK
MFQYLARFLFVLSDSKKKLLFFMGVAIIASSLEAVGIGMVGPFIAVATKPDAMDPGSSLANLFTLLGGGELLKTDQGRQQVPMVVGAAVVLVFYVKAFLSFYVQKYIFQFGYEQRSRLFSRLLSAYSRAPYTYHLSHNSSELIQSTVNETEEFAHQVLMPVLFVVSNSLLVVAILSLLVMTDALAIVIVMGIVGVTFLLFQRFKNRISFWGKEKSESFASSIRIITHALGGLKEVRVIGCESYFEQQAAEQAKRYAASGASYLAFSNLPRYAIEAFMVTFLVGFTFAYLMFNKGNVGNLSSILGIFAMASIRMLPAVSMLVGSISSLRYATHCMDKMYMDLKDLEKILPMDQRRLLEESTGYGLARRTLPFNREVVVDQAAYRYPTATEASLKGISLHLKKGQSIGLIGRSGAGKTTLVDVLLGLLTPETGDIRVDGQSIYGDIRAWQNMIGYVPQNIFLTDDTLERNIALGVPDHLIDYERLEQAVQAAQLGDMVAMLPDGLRTVLGERGTRLSGGQRQRVGIARVLYHDREILVLDEATAALDNETELLISDAVKALGGTKTLIIIAHRLSTIEHCDCIYMLERGQVVKSGTYEEVVLGIQTPTPQPAIAKP